MMARSGVSTSTTQRVLVIGLDMGDGDLIRHWSQEGRLPRFAALLSSGTWIDLESTAQVLHTSTWPTFATGALPGRHGVYFPYQPQPGHQLAQHIRPDQYGVPTFWHWADAQGCQCVIYDVPETFPEPHFGGKAIFDWGTWAWYGKPCSQPASLLRDVKSRYGRYPLGFEAKRLGAAMPNGALLEKRLLQSVEYKRKTAQELLQREAWDLAVIGFCEPHPAGHYLWPPHADTVHGGDEARFQPLLRVYAAIDHALGTICDSLSADVTVLVVSGDGVRPNHCGWYLLPTVLQRLGYTCPVGTTTDAQGTAPAPSFISRVKSLMPPGTRRFIADSLPWWLRDHMGAREQAANIDWAKTRAFTLPTDLEGCIRINLKGREPQGIVEPGQEYTVLCHEIRDALEELIHPDTGVPAVRRVWLRNEIFPGDRQEHLPDVIVTWNDAAPFTSLTSPRLGHVDQESADPRPGTHSPYGFLLAAGAGVPSSRQGCGHLTDVAPTVLNLFGLDVPTTMDGVPLSLLGAPSPEQRPFQQTT